MEHKNFADILQEAKTRQAAVEERRQRDMARYTAAEFAAMEAEAAAFSPEEADAPARYRQLCCLMPLLHQAEPNIHAWGREESTADLGSGHVWLELGFTARISRGEPFRLWQQLQAAADAVYFTWLPKGVRITFTVFGSARP